MIPRQTPDFSLQDDVPLHVVLVEPEIPQNTGNIARLCAGTGAWLHLVEPLSFVLESKYVRRAGLDYWPAVRLSVHPSLQALERLLPPERTWLFTKVAPALHTDVTYGRGDVLVFGRETTGLPEDFLARMASRQLRIPTTSNVRSLNVANCVGIAAYEVLRQLGWRGETPMPS